VRDSISPSPAWPARRAPSTENVACQIRSAEGGRRRIEPVAAGQRAAIPGRAHLLEIVAHQFVARGAVEAEGGEGGEVAARPDAHFEAVLAHQVEHGGILGDADAPSRAAA
jgi:hypothetical protein